MRRSAKFVKSRTHHGAIAAITKHTAQSGTDVIAVRIFATTAARSLSIFLRWIAVDAGIFSCSK
jgi:hypothetical protein